MSNARYRKSPPKWAERGDFFDEEPASLGTPWPLAPQLPTRVLPLKDAHAVPSPFLGELIFHTQQLVYISAQIAAYGTNPEFFDTKHIDAPLRKLATLSVSAFGDGSFVIPAELAIDSIEVTSDTGKKTVTTSEIVATFSRLMKTLSDTRSDDANDLPIGIVQRVEDIGKSIGKHASRIEYDVQSDSDDSQPPIVIDREFAQRATKVLERRKGKVQSGFVTVTGELMALDLINKKVKIRTVQNGIMRNVVGRFDMILAEKLVRNMASEIEVYGPGTYRNRVISEVTIMSIKEED